MKTIVQNKVSSSESYINEDRIGSPWRQVSRRFRRNKLALLGLFILIVLVSISFLTPWIAPYEPAEMDLFNVEAPPGNNHILGTDELGRDLLTRLMYGSRVSLSVGLVATVMGVLIGTVLGSIAGYYGGFIDASIMRLVDIMLSFPTLFLLIILAAYIQTTVLGIMIIIGSTSWMTVSRLVRAEFLSLKEKEFSEAAVVLGVGDKRIILKHLLPNAFAPVIVAATLQVGYTIIYESALSYLGVGIQPPTASWGNMLTNAQSYIWTSPWLAFWPGFCIFLTVLAINFVGDGLRDALDPRLKGTN